MKSRQQSMVCLALTLCINAFSAYAQQVDITAQQGPYYVGRPTTLQVTAQGFAEDPQPTCQPGQSSAVSLELVGVRPQVSVFTQVDFSGRQTVQKQITYKFTYQATARRTGSHIIPAFTVKQDKKVAKTRSVELRFEEIEIDPNMRVALTLPKWPVYPGQRVPVTVEWWHGGTADEIQASFEHLVIYSSFFDQFSFIDDPPKRGDQALPLSTQKGRIRIKAEVSKRVLDGREYLVVSGTRKLVVTEEGTYDLPPITASTKIVTKWRRTFFGREPLGYKMLRAVGEPQTLLVRQIPVDDAPPSFAGAVGHGFSIETKTDRSVIQIGDPITLIVTIRGHGNLDQAGLPSVSTPATNEKNRFDPQHFRLSSEDAAGVVSQDGTSKQFSLTLRVMNESVSQIPPIAYSWFEPQQQRFEVVHSDPIAIQVLPTQMVGAQDVIHADPLDKPAFQPTNPPIRAIASNQDPNPLITTGADLSIETNTILLLHNESDRYGGKTTLFILYTTSIGLIFLAWLWRRHTDMDPQLVIRRKIFRQQLACIHRAEHLPNQSAATEIADALRMMAGHITGEQRVELDQVVAACDVVAYRPTIDKHEHIDPDLYHRAINIAQHMVATT